MKTIRSLFILLALVTGVSTNCAWASHSPGHFVAHHGYAVHHGGWHHPGWRPVFYGPWPWFYPSWYVGYAVPLFPNTIYAESPPPTQYIEMNPPANPPADIQPNLWYYCANPQGYYPYVKSCSTAWQTVPAQPPKQ
jgi:hypothetical protein